MELIEREILNQALEAFRSKFAMPEECVIVEEGTDGTFFDAVVRIMDVDFLCEIKSSVTTASFNTILNRIQAKTTKQPILLVAGYISPAVLDELTNNGVNTLDCAGNCHIRYMKGKKLFFQLSNKGEKSMPVKEKSYPVFQETGIKVIFYFIQNQANVNKTYREIQEATGVSLGSIKNVINELIVRNFILSTRSGRVLKNKKQLFDLWVENYNQNLKPKLLLGRMSFRTNEQRMNWQSMELPEGMYWSGESGSYLIDTYLEPGSFDVYTDIPTANLMKTGFVKQEENGEISIYRKFWNWSTENHLAPLVLIYADLMGSGNSRCLEMAKRLLDNELNDYK